MRQNLFDLGIVGARCFIVTGAFLALITCLSAIAAESPDDRTVPMPPALGTAPAPSVRTPTQPRNKPKKPVLEVPAAEPPPPVEVPAARTKPVTKPVPRVRKAPERAPRVAPVEPAAAPLASGAADPAEESGRVSPIDTRADELDYNRRTGWIEARGNVLIRKGTEELQADYVRVNVNTEDALAFGNVILKRGDEVWRGERLQYNFRTRTGDAAGLTGDTGPFKFLAEESTRLPDNQFAFEDAEVTTCTNAAGHWHYHVRARRVSVVPNERLKAYGAVWYFGRVPVMYVPYWYRNLREDSGFRVYAGHTSRMGTFVLTSYRYRLTDVLRAETHVDYRSERGVAFGQDFKWREPESGKWRGEVKGYYLDDDKPVDDDEDPATKDVENERYRVYFEHAADFTFRDSLLTRFQYLSDAFMLEDFFEDDYREENVPDNYASYTHRGDRFTVNALVRGRLNDFYEGVNRIPEVSLEVLRQEIFDTSVYYEGQSAAANLERVYKEENQTDEDYSAFRFDTEHTLYRPSKLFGFLSLNPRAGWRGTYYSDTKATETRTVTSASVETNQVITGTTTNFVPVTITSVSTNTVLVEGAADFRSRVELGLEASFKAFKTWDSMVGERRHIVEPYANWTFVPEPSLLPEDIYQFDEIDELDEEHFVRFGVRNKLQRKKDGNPFDIADVNVYTRYRIERDDDEDAIDRVFFDGEFRPGNNVNLDVDAEYDVEEATLDIFNARLWVEQSRYWATDIEYRYRYEESSLLLADLTLYVNPYWTVNTFGRYEFEESRLEEQGGYLQRNLDCMSFRFGASMLPGYERTDGTERDDEIRFLFQFWLSAFPDVAIGGKHKH